MCPSAPSVPSASHVSNGMCVHSAPRVWKRCGVFVVATCCTRCNVLRVLRTHQGFQTLKVQPPRSKLAVSSC
eukprot:1579442-Lingulodinium_polyedra.AAC.1